MIPEAVIPAKAGIQIENNGFRVKPGMTIKVKGFLTQYTNIVRRRFYRVLVSFQENRQNKGRYMNRG